MSSAEMEMEVERLYQRAVDTLTGVPTARKLLLEELLHRLIPEAPEKEVPESLQFHVVRLLWQLSCSNSGSEVRTSQPADAAWQSSPQFGVLILGFAGAQKRTCSAARCPCLIQRTYTCSGANMGMLRQTEKIYQELWPSCLVVTTTGIGLVGDRADAILRRQLNDVAAALAQCDRLVVHAMSNHGHWLWTEMLRQLPSFCKRLCAMVCDCGPSALSSFSPTLLKEVCLK